MAKSDGTVYVDTLIDTKGFGKGVNTMQKQVSGLSGAIGKLGAAIAATFAVGKLIQFGKKAIQLGSDLEEVQNVVDVTFTTMNEQVNEFARNAAESAGLSETMAKRYVGTFGAMSKAFGFAENEAFEMSTALTQLAGDVASFYNISQDEAYTKLKSVFTGETETLKDLGVVMTQNALDSYAMAKGYGKTTKAMTEQEKVALRYSFVLDQLSASQGDFVRTSDSWANQTRILSLTIDSLKANIGQGLINIFTPLLKVINQVVDKMAELSKYFVAFSELIVGKSTSGGGGSPGDALAEIQDGYDGITDSTKEAAKAQNKYLTGLDEIKTFSDNKSVDTSTGGAGGLAGLAGSTAGEVADTASLIEKLEQKYPELIKFAQDSIAKLKEIFADFASGDFFEAGQDTSDLITGIFNFFADAIDSVDWTGIGNKIGDYLAGIDWIEVIKAGFRLKFNIWKAIAEVWLGMFDAAPLETAVITAIAALKFTPLGAIISKKISGVLIGGSLTSGIIGAFKSLGGIGGILTMDLKTIIGAGSATEIGLALGSYIIGGLLAAFVGNEVGKKIGAALFPDMKEEYENFKWFGEGGFFDEMFSTDLQTHWDAIVLMSEDATNGLIGILNKVKKEINGTALEFDDLLFGLDDLFKIYSPIVKNWFEKDVKPFFSKEKWGEISNELLNNWNNIIANAKKFGTKICDNFTFDFTRLKTNITNIISNLLSSLDSYWNNMFSNSSNWGSRIYNNITNIYDKLKTSVSSAISNLYVSLHNKWSNIASNSNQWVSYIYNSLTRGFTNVRNSVVNIFNSLSSGIKNSVNNVIYVINCMIVRIVNGINSAIFALNKLSFSIPSWIPEIGGKNFGLNIGYVSAPQIPYLATGAVIPPNAPFMAMLGDQKNGNNLEMPENLLRKIIREESGNSGGNNSYTFQGTINRRVLFEEFIEEAKLQKSMTGRNPLDLAGGV